MYPFIHQLILMHFKVNCRLQYIYPYIHQHAYYYQSLVYVYSFGFFLGKIYNEIHNIHFDKCDHCVILYIYFYYQKNIIKKCIALIICATF